MGDLNLTSSWAALLCQLREKKLRTALHARVFYVLTDRDKTGHACIVPLANPIQFPGSLFFHLCYYVRISKN
jgi:hypothetical protein